ncbi:hypothetical protein EVAR_69134_1 [Eumeta japonica]|uniref:Uncharacterized protein n=1 Tax=Eumeta variegata TaxID=151549 RepID=A0A4C1SI91_EUMVA|nr:hypothetical protein EVAR_69134_1 [Eumeta japonica]
MDELSVKCLLYADVQVINAPLACRLQKMKIESRINVTEMRSMHGMCGVSLKDRCRNSDVRERCGLQEDVVTRVERDMYAVVCPPGKAE